MPILQKGKEMKEFTEEKSIPFTFPALVMMFFAIVFYKRNYWIVETSTTTNGTIQNTWLSKIQIQDIILPHKIKCLPQTILRLDL